MLGNWFQSHLGVVTGIVMAASGVGGSALSLVLSGIMESAGWRASLLFAAGTVAGAGHLSSPSAAARRISPKRSPPPGRACPCRCC